jgi:hypothetical protein
MAKPDSLSGAAGPFLLEALEASRPAPSPDEFGSRVARAARGLSPGARRHLERAFVAQLAQGGRHGRAALGAALQALRGRLRQAHEGERALDELEAESPFLEREWDHESPFLAREAADEQWDEASVAPEAELGDAPATRDPLVAVPVWGAAERQRVESPLLSAAKHAKAAASNAKLHPAISGVTPDDLRAALRPYVDFDAVARAVRAAGLPQGAAPFDTLLVEAIRTFQRKCYLKPAQADGVAGESTLDSLGLIRHRLKPAIDPTNDHVVVLVRARAAQIEAATGGDFKAERWYADFVNPAFLGHKFKIGVHPMLVRQLRLAEKHLLSLPAYAGLTPVALGRALGFDENSEEHAGGRQRRAGSKVTQSRHPYGLAIDVRHMLNPWVAGNPDAPHGNARFIEVMQRATLLLDGRALRVDPSHLSTLSSLGTREAWTRLRDLSSTLRQYLTLAGDGAALRRRIESGSAAAGVLRAGESPDQAAARWGRQIADDARALRRGNFPYKDARDGFLELPLDLVVALRDHAGLAWGAIDFGAAQSGDVMHFDMRRTPLGQATHPTARAAKPKSKPKPKPKAKPKAPAAPPAQTRVSTEASDPPGRTLYTQAPIESARQLSSVGVFVPEGFRPRADIDLVVYLHGLLGPCSSPGPGIERYWDTALKTPHHGRGQGPMALREEFAAARTSAVLVAPSLGWKSVASALVAPGGLDTLVERVLAALRERGGLRVAPTSVRHVVLAGHSKGGDHMRRIVGAGGDAAGRIRECWGFDCFYSGVDPESWLAWSKAGAQADRRLFHYYLESWHKDKASGQAYKAAPWRHTEILRRLAREAGLRNVVLEFARDRQERRANHCEVPMAYLRRRLEGSDFLERL